MSIRPRAQTVAVGNAPAMSNIQCGLPTDGPDVLECDNRQKRAASALNVDHEQLKPISWLNEAHYQQLQQKNALDETFVRRIEAFRKEEEIKQQIVPAK